MTLPYSFPSVKSPFFEELPLVFLLYPFCWQWENSYTFPSAENVYLSFSWRYFHWIQDSALIFILFQSFKKSVSLFCYSLLIYSGNKSKYIRIHFPLCVMYRFFSLPVSRFNPCICFLVVLFWWLREWFSLGLGFWGLAELFNIYIYVLCQIKFSAIISPNSFLMSFYFSQWLKC